jgi:stage III sporulation protein SpoIIIAA
MRLEEQERHIVVGRKLVGGALSATGKVDTYAQVAKDGNTLVSDRIGESSSSVASESGIGSSLVLGGIPTKPGLNTMLERCGLPINAHKKKVHKMMDKADRDSKNTLWTQRPMPDILVTYAADDVRYLLRASEVLMEKLDSSFRQIVVYLSEIYADGKRKACRVGGGDKNSELGGKFELGRGEKVRRHLVGLNLHLEFVKGGLRGGECENSGVDLDAFKAVYEVAPLYENVPEAHEKNDASKEQGSEVEELEMAVDKDVTPSESETSGFVSAVGDHEISTSVTDSVTLGTSTSPNQQQVQNEDEFISDENDDATSSLIDLSERFQLDVCRDDSAKVTRRVNPSQPSTSADVLALLEYLPVQIRDAIIHDLRDHLDDVCELAFDVGRIPEARFLLHTPRTNTSDYRDDQKKSCPPSLPFLHRPVTHDDIVSLCEHLKFGPDRRAGIEGHLHRISVIENKVGNYIGVTMRIARVKMGSAEVLKDFLSQGLSVLVVGKPGKGKTTLLRDIARLISTDLGKRTIVVDTSNEVGGDGDCWHPALGDARRMQVGSRNQDTVMLEAVKNRKYALSSSHEKVLNNFKLLDSPQVLIIDELGKKSECVSTRTIINRGVQLIATAHGNTLQDVLSNPDLDTLVGGKQSVTLGDAFAKDMAKEKKMFAEDDGKNNLSSVRKTVTERGGQPTFHVVVELVDYNEWVIHSDVSKSVDGILSGSKNDVLVERRWEEENTGNFVARFEYMAGKSSVLGGFNLGETKI